MSTFEEQFPSLVGWIDSTNMALGPVVRCKQVQFYCLDKQKVRETIDKWKMRSLLLSGQESEEMINVVLLKSELGL